MMESPFFLVWRRHGRVPHFEHRERYAAVEEAKRVARMCPGEDVFVLAVTHRLCVNDVIVEHFDPTEELPF